MSWRRRRRSTSVQLYSDAVSALSLTILTAVILQRWSGAIVLMLAVCLVGWAWWRARDKPLLHATPWRQWPGTIASLASGVFVIGLAVLVVYYYGV